MRIPKRLINFVNKKIKKGTDIEPLRMEVNNEVNQLKILLSNNSGDGENLENKIKSAKEKISSDEKLIDELTEQIAEGIMNSDDDAKVWKDKVNDLLMEISESFEQSFDAIKCKGKVELEVPKDVQNFKEYGVKIMVAYRKNEKLKPLGPYIQSGGERSVATALYLMALQSLTKCPFRCVDEINQGMDSKNEELVFQLMTQAAVNDKSQYFLLTPKLLSSLKFTPEITIMGVGHIRSGLLKRKKRSKQANAIDNFDDATVAPCAEFAAFSEEMKNLYRIGNKEIAKR